ncbi:MAG: EamA family transporter [Deltaproteobacteria bacterium]|nr:EamA family transporter [Deltaproteobacteria bacterium]
MGRRLQPEAVFAVSATSMYLGAALAVTLFAELPPVAVAWLRVLFAGLLLLPFSTLPRERLGLIAAFGIALTCMNLTFYMAISIIPMGSAVAIEFLGPIVVALFAERTLKNTAAVVSVGAGVFLLAGARPADELTGVFWAMGAAACWAAYIALGHRLAEGGEGRKLIGPAMLFGVLVTSPLCLPLASPVVASPRLLGACVLVGLLSSAIPYSLEQWVFARVSRDRFAILLGLLPACAALLGLSVLGQSLSALEWLGIGLVGLAVALKR